jgi:hypothetical protein
VSKVIASLLVFLGKLLDALVLLLLEILQVFEFFLPLQGRLDVLREGFVLEVALHLVVELLNVLNQFILVSLHHLFVAGHVWVLVQLSTQFDCALLQLSCHSLQSKNCQAKVVTDISRQPGS